MLFCLQLCFSLRWGKATEFYLSQLMEYITTEYISASIFFAKLTLMTEPMYQTQLLTFENQ